MKDIFGNELSVGDEVAFTDPSRDRKSLVVGNIAIITEQMLVISYAPLWATYADASYRTTTRKFPKDVVRKIYHATAAC